MYNADDLIKQIKRAAMEAMESQKPANFLYGTVLSTEPLVIQTESKMQLRKAQLRLARAVTEHWVEISVEHETEPGPDGHKHQYLGRKRFLVHGQLLQGERVLLAQRSGGQEYVVLDRIEEVSS